MPREAFWQSVDFPHFALVRYPFSQHAFSGELGGSIAAKAWRRIMSPMRDVYLISAYTNASERRALAKASIDQPPGTSRRGRRSGSLPSQAIPGSMVKPTW
jgi:hypothetical protein